MKLESRGIWNVRGQRVGHARVEGGVSTSLLAAAAASIFLLAAGTARAADDRFDRTKFDGLGGFQPVANDEYRKECGACHFAYLPGLLPSRSWNLVMDGLDKHFGENVQLTPAQNASVRAYLVANAAEKVPDRGPGVILERLDPGKTPARITALPLISRKHLVVMSVLKNNTHAQTQLRGIANCDSCHEKAGQGSFALRDLVVPHVTKVVQPGGMF